MRFNIFTAVEVFDDELHSSLIDRYIDESMEGLTSNTSKDEDLGYAEFTIDFNRISGDVPERLNDILTEIQTHNQTSFSKMIVNYHSI